VDIIHKNGLKAWIWWVPGYIDSATLIATEHPEWLIKNPDGAIHSAYGLCPAYQPVQDHYKKLVKKFVTEYKLDGFKLDFGVINSAAPCYDPAHNHRDPYESFFSTPVLFKNILETARQYNPDILIEYCACSIPPTYFHFPYFNLAVTSDPNITQITERIKLYKALRSPDFPVLEEYCGVLAGPTYEYTIGTGGVPGTFSTILDDYHEKWLGIYHKYQLSKGEYLNLYDAGFDYPEGHAIRKDNKMYYAFYTHPWRKMDEIPRRWWRFGNEFDHKLQDLRETQFPAENFSGKIELRGLEKNKTYDVTDYANNRTLGTIRGRDPYLSVSFDNSLLLELTPVR